MVTGASENSAGNRQKLGFILGKLIAPSLVVMMVQEREQASNRRECCGPFSNGNRQLPDVLVQLLSKDVVGGCDEM